MLKRTLDDRKYKFVWPECQGMSGEECRATIENDLPWNVIENVTVQLSTPRSHPQQVEIAVNSQGQVIGKDNHGIVSTTIQWNGRNVGPWNCIGRNYKQCCRHIERQTTPDEQGVSIGCYKLAVSATAMVRKSLQDEVTYTEYLYNEESKKIELLYIDHQPMVIQVHLDSENKVHQTPVLNAQLDLNPATEWANYIFSAATGSSSQDPYVSTNTMAIAGSGTSMFPEHIGDTWWYSIPFFIAISTFCFCCGFAYFMCCIPVDGLGDDDSDVFNAEKGLGHVSKVF